MAKINNVLNKVSNVGNIVNSAVNKVGGVFTSDDYTPSSIRDKYTNGFFGDTTHFTPSVFARLFDEPTYLTFRIKFDTGSNFRNNPADASHFYSLDYLPEALLNKPKDAKTGKDANTGEYSAYYYLKDVLGETKRAEMLNQLISEINDIQNNYPYYFTEISGLASLSKIDTGGGIRIKDDAVIEIKCYDAIDLKITQWMQMYRKIAWDDVYQRWILPDIMRFFNMKIYVSEIRLFHDMSKSIITPKRGRLYEFTGNNGGGANATSYDQLSSGGVFSKLGSMLNATSALSSRVLGTESTMTNILNTANQIGDTATGLISGLNNSIVRLCNNAINDFMPTICYDCHMCQFIIDDTLSSINSLKSSKPEMHGTTIKISVGQVLETQSYPLNIGLGISDKRYKANPESPYFASYYIDDDILKKEATYTAKEDYKMMIDGSDGTFSAGINRVNNRINDELSYKDNTEDSYQIFNSNAAVSANALITAICNKFQKSDVLSTATNTSSEEAKSAVKQISQGVSEIFTSRADDASMNRDKIYAGSDKSRETATPETDTGTADKLSELSDYNTNTVLSRATNLAENGDAADEIRKQIRDMFTKYTAGEISTATAVLNEIYDIVDNNEQLNTMAQTTEIAEQLKSNIAKSILTEIANSSDDTGTNGALIKLSQIALSNSSTEFSTATSEENREKLTGFSLLN